MKVKYLFMCMLFAAAFIKVQSQEKRAIVLNEALEMSIRNSKQLKLSHARIDESTAAFKEALQKKLPDAGVTGSYMRLSSANIDLKSQNGNGGNSPKVSQALYGILNVSLPVYAGGRIQDS